MSPNPKGPWRLENRYELCFVFFHDYTFRSCIAELEAFESALDSNKSEKELLQKTT